jgi:hypothetical protein
MYRCGTMLSECVSKSPSDRAKPTGTTAFVTSPWRDASLAWCSACVRPGPSARLKANFVCHPSSQRQCLRIRGLR